MNWATTRRATREENIPCFKRKVLANIANERVYFIKHITRAALLYGISIDVKMEMKPLKIKEVLFWDPFSEGSSAIKAFSKFPR